MKKPFLLLFLIVLGCGNEKETDKNPFVEFDSSANYYIPVNFVESRDIIRGKHFLSENLKAFKSEPFTRRYLGKESIRLTLVFALHAPIQLLFEDGKLSYFELDYPVALAYDGANPNVKYTIKKQYTYESSLDIETVLDELSSSNFCNDFSDFEHEMDTDGTVSLLEINSASGYCQIGIECLGGGVREKPSPDDLVKLLLKSLPKELLESESLRTL